MLDIKDLNTLIKKEPRVWKVKWTTVISTCVDVSDSKCNPCNEVILESHPTMDDVDATDDSPWRKPHG